MVLFRRLFFEVYVGWFTFFHTLTVLIYGIKRRFFMAKVAET